MKVIYRHSFGLQSQAEVYHFSATLVDVAADEHDDVLSQGWLATIKNNQPQWYQCRSTRCKLSDISYTQINNSSILDPVPAAEIDHIYSAYCLYKGFKKYFEVSSTLPWDMFIGYNDNTDDLIAWSKLRKYSNQSIETVLFAWDYRNPKLQLGIKSLHHELAWAKANSYRYVYMGPGYEKINKYKADIVGFEWWTGSEWSSDVDEYKWLCNRDSRIKHCEGLHDL